MAPAAPPVSTCFRLRHPAGQRPLRRRAPPGHLLDGCAIPTHLTPSSAPNPHTAEAVSSLMDTWLLLEDELRDGERGRQCYVLKSRGMDHSKRVHEYSFHERGILFRSA